MFVSCLGPFLTLWWHQLFKWSAGAAASQLLRGKDLIDWLRKPFLSWDALFDPVEMVSERRMISDVSPLVENMSHPMLERTGRTGQLPQ